MLSAFQVFNGLAPDGAPFAASYILDLRTQLNLDFDLVKEQDGAGLNFVQSIVVDNTVSTQQLSITTQGLQSKLKIGAGQYAILPIIGTGHMRFNFSVPALALAVIPLVFLNVPMPHLVWQP